MKKHVITVGEIIWDIFDDGKILGGAPLNVARHLVRHNIYVSLISTVGDDYNGKEAIEKIVSEGIHLKGTVVPRSITGAATIVKKESGEHEFEICKNCAWEHIILLDDEKKNIECKQIDAVVFGSLAMNFDDNKRNLEFLYSLRGKNDGGLFVCDLNTRAPYYSFEVVQWCLQKCDVLKVNEEELKLLGEYFSIEEEKVVSLLIEKFSLQWICITYGEKGIDLIDKNGVSTHGEAVAVNSLVDTVGAGDSVTAALVYGLIHSLEPHKIVKHATSLAATVCSHSGAIPNPYPSYKN